MLFTRLAVEEVCSYPALCSGGYGFNSHTESGSNMYYLHVCVSKNYVAMSVVL